MSKFDLVMPKLGESIIEATIIRWLKNEGDPVVEDESLVEIATDKVDSEIPSPVAGVISKLFFKEGDVIPVGKIIAEIRLEGSEPEPQADTAAEPVEAPQKSQEVKVEPQTAPEETTFESTRFYSPLVKSIAKQENISLQELENLTGSGKENRLTKQDLVTYLQNRNEPAAVPAPEVAAKAVPASTPVMQAPPVVAGQGDTIVEMDRMRKLIADHMVMSKHTSPHVTSFIEVDVTPVVRWREKVKEEVLKSRGQKLTFMPIFTEVVAKALQQFPNVNASVDGTKIIQRKQINIGIATALPNGNLIVPVVKNANQKNLLGLAADINGVADRARNSKLSPDDTQGGTFTISNFGTFDTLTGTPVINQPQVAILGVGAVKKRPWVLETPQGDMIAIRHICMLSLSYDHRLVDGGLAGQFLKYIQQSLESYNENQVI